MSGNTLVARPIIFRLGNQMKRLFKIFDRTLRNAKRTAKAFLQNEHPNFCVYHTALRAEEEDRFVFAVFYTLPEKMVKPTPYMLVAIHRKDLAAKIIDPPQESEYWIRGRR